MTQTAICPIRFGDDSERQVPRPVFTRLNRSLRIQWILVSTPLIIIAFISRVGMIAWPFLNDSGLYAAMGRTVANGGTLYRDFYETKLPGAGLLAATFWIAFGHHWTGYILCQLVMALAASIMLARIAQVRSLPTFLFAIVFLNLSQLVYTGFQLETIEAFFEAVAAVFACRALKNGARKSVFFAGLAAGLAAMAKPGGIGIAAAFCLILLFKSPKHFIHIAALCVGVLMPTVGTLIYTVRSGAWPFLPDVLHDIQNYAAGTPVDLSSALKVFVALAFFAFPFVVRLFAKRGTTSKAPMLGTFVVAWFVADLFAVLLQRRLYPYHFLPLACPAALLYGMMPRRATPMYVAAGILPIALISLTWEGSTISQLRRGFVHMPVSNYIVSHTQSTDAVCSDQIGRLLIETDRQPGSRLGTFFYFVNDDDAPRRYCQLLLSDFQSRKPKYLVLANGWDTPVPSLANCDILQHCPQRRANFIAAWAILRDYVAGHYHHETTIDGMMIYRRNTFEQRSNPSTRGPASSGRTMDRSTSAVQKSAGNQPG